MQIQKADPDSRVIRQTPLHSLRSLGRWQCAAGMSGWSGAVRAQRIHRAEKLALSVVPIARSHPAAPLPLPLPLLTWYEPPHPEKAARRPLARSGGAPISPCFAHLGIWKWGEGERRRDGATGDRDRSVDSRERRCNRGWRKLKSLEVTPRRSMRCGVHARWPRQW